MKARAIIEVVDRRYSDHIGFREKTFDVEPRENGKLYSEELVNWVTGIKNRRTNYIVIVANGKAWTYSL